MKINKLKYPLIAAFCVVTLLRSEIQGMEHKEEKEVPVHMANQHCLTGSIMPFAGEFVGEGHGWLMCDGKQYSANKYPELYKVIKEKYVPSDSWTIEASKVSFEKFFHVPDLRGRVIVGVDAGIGRVTSNNTLGESGGEEKHLLNEKEMPVHTHSVRLPTKSDYTRSSGVGGSATYDCVYSQQDTSYSGDDQPHNNMQPYLVLNYIIKY